MLSSSLLCLTGFFRRVQLVVVGVMAAVRVRWSYRAM